MNETSAVQKNYVKLQKRNVWIVRTARILLLVGFIFYGSSPLLKESLIPLYLADQVKLLFAFGL